MSPLVRSAMATVKMKVALKYGDFDLFTSARRDLIRLGRVDRGSWNCHSASSATKSD